MRDDPDLIRGAVEEMLRYFSPGTGIARTAVRDTMVGGTCIQAGERVFVGAGAANADPAVFEDPDTLDVRRDATRHVAFGAGAHRCLGSFLVSREMEILLGEVLTRLPDLRVDESGVVPYDSIPMVGGFRAMPATFTPGAATGRFPVGEVPPSRADRALAR